MRIWTVIAAVIVLALVISCAAVTPAQQQSATALQQQIAATQSRLNAYSEQVAAIKAAIDNKTLPVEEGAALLVKVLANYQADAAQVKQLAAAFDAAKEAGVPWYYYVGMILSVGLGAAGTYFPVAKPLQLIVSALMSGIEQAGDPKTKAAVSTIASGLGVEDKLYAMVQAAYPSPVEHEEGRASAPEE